MRLERLSTRVNPLGEHRRAIQQLSRHPNPLRTLPRKHKHNPTSPTASIPTHNIPRGATLSQRTKTIQQLITPTTNNNSTILKHAARKQRKPNIGHIQLRISPQKLKQPTRLPSQRALTPRREHQRHHTNPQHPHTNTIRHTTNTIHNPNTIHTNTDNPIHPDRIQTNTDNPIDPNRITNHHTTTHTTIQNRCFLQNHMRVRTTSPKRRNTRTTRLTITLPHNLLSQKRHRTSRPINLPRRTIDMQRTRQHTTPQSHHHLDHTTHTSSRLRMTNIRLQRPQPQRITTTQPTIRSQQRLRLNRIAQHRPSPMTLNHIHPSSRHPSIQQRLTNHPLLRRTIRRRQTITRTILIHRTTTNNSQHPMTQTQSIRQTLQQQNTNTLAPAGAVSRISKRLTPPIRSQCTLAREPQEQRGRPHNRYTAYESQRTLTFSKRLRRAVECDKRRGARGVNRNRRSLKSKSVGNATRYDAATGASPHARLKAEVGGTAPAGRIVVVHRSGEHPGLTTSQARMIETCVFDRLPAGFQHQSLLGIHDQCLSRTYVKEIGIEIARVMQESTLTRVARADMVRIGVIQPLQIPPTIRWHAADCVSTFSNKLPQVLR